ncbi:peroxisomal multifunctional enzyme type 2-like [Ptychodera flava]|uniref:peroxisomal multifunctional enzyme type 2-like n=1 Tax=Ptychodera flava TaxID=63121 RepID=UPI00396AB00B
MVLFGKVVRSGNVKATWFHISQGFRQMHVTSVTRDWHKELDNTVPEGGETRRQVWNNSVSKRTLWTKPTKFRSQGGTPAGNFKKFDLDKAVGFKTQPIPFSYTERDAALYALGVGVKVNQPDYLKFLYEGNDDFSILPTYAAVVGQVTGEILFSDKIPGFKINRENILHGEQYLEVYKPLPPSGQLSSTLTIVDILDKRSGALVIADIHIYNESNELTAYNQLGYFEVGAGKFGGRMTSEHVKPTVSQPSRNPDNVVEEETLTSQAALYRLSGDFNPLHIDPSFSAKGGLPIPILHGLCTFGHAARHVLMQYADNDVTKFKAMKVRFSRPVIPGQTVRTEMWKEGNRIHIQCKVAENGETVITGAYIDLALE